MKKLCRAKRAQLFASALPFGYVAVSDIPSELFPDFLFQKSRFMEPRMIFLDAIKVNIISSMLPIISFKTSIYLKKIHYNSSL